MTRNNKLQVQKLNFLGLNVVAIDESIFVVQSFYPADRSLDCTKIIGQDVTDLLDTNSVVNIQANDAITQRIEALPKEERQFHKDFKWTFYVRR